MTNEITRHFEEILEEGRDEEKKQARRLKENKDKRIKQKKEDLSIE